MFKEVKRVFKDTVVYGLGSLLPKAAGIILVPIYTRFLSRADYGLIALATMITTMVSNVMLFGQQGSLMLYLRQLENEDRQDDGGQLVFSAVSFVLVAGAVLYVLLMVGGSRLTDIVTNLPGFTFDPYMQLALTTAVLLLPFSLLQAVNRSRGQSGTHTALQLTSFALNTTITVYMVVVLRKGAPGSLQGNLGAALLLWPLSMYFLIRNMRFRFSRTWLKRSLAFGLPLVPHFFAGWMLTFSDRWILGLYRSPDELGLYALAYNVSMVLNMVVLAVNTAWGPVYYDLASSDDGRKKLPRLITVYAAAITVVAIGYLLVSREVLLLLAGPRFHAAAPLVPIIVAGYFAFAMYAVVSTGIFFAKKTKLIPLISAGAAAVNIGLNLLLVPTYGMWAAAWMTLVSYSIMALAARYYSGKFVTESFEDRRLATLVGIFVAVFLANAGINALGLALWISLLAKLAVFGLSVGSMLWLDVIAIREARSLVERVMARRRGKRTTEEERDIVAAEETVDGAMSDDTGFKQGR